MAKNPLIEEQRNTKPLFEDAAVNFLEGDRLKNALDFAAFLRENGINPRWASGNAWRATGKKSKPICRIDLGGLPHKHLRPLQVGDWQINELEGLARKHFDEFIDCDEMKEFIWANIRLCNRCYSCGPRRWTYAGKEFTQCCGMRIINPDAKGLEFAKKIVLANKRFIYENA